MPLAISSWAYGTIATVTVLALSVASYFVVRRLVMPLIHRAIKKTTFQWDDILLDTKLLHRIALLAPFVVFWILTALCRLLASTDEQTESLAETNRQAEIFLEAFWESSWLGLVLQLDQAIVTILVVRVISAALDATNKLYSTFAISRQRPIKGYLQIITIFVWVFGLVIFLAVLTGQEVGYFITGLGAMTAILLLIFKDTILSLVASIQLSQNDMVRVGDWVEVPSENADGDVIDIALHTVKIQNFDKTVTTVPTFKLIQSGFRNWRGMSESGGRRIKRSILIDMATVRFLTEEEVEELSRFAPLRDYMQSKRQELAAHNDKIDGNVDDFGDPRRLTNIGTLRAYIVHYLRAHPKLHQTGMTLLVRQLEPTPKGLPIEVYVFANDTNWGNFEDIQADIFDHLLAMLPQFDLRAFQEPSSGDISAAFIGE